MTTNHFTGDAPHLRELVPTKQGDNVSAVACYSSPEALARHAGDTVQGTCWHKSPWTHSESFSGSPDMSSAIKMAVEGWPDGAARAAKIRDRINASHPTMRRMTRYSVAGALPNIGRYLSGNPACMRVMTSDKSRQRPIMTLIASVTANVMIEANQLLWRAAVVAAIVDAVEGAGFACEVIAVSNSEANGVNQAVLVNAKNSHQPADISRLAYSLGHPSFFRRLCWVPIVENEITSPIGTSLGAATTLDMTRMPSNCYLIPGFEDNAAGAAFGTEEKAETTGLEFLLESLRAQGCPAFTSQN